MSITTTTTISSESSTNERLPVTDVNHRQNSTSFHKAHYVNERYPKTCLEDIPSIILEYPRPKIGNQLTRSHHSLRFRTQPVTLSEINEADEENKNDNDNQQQQQQQQQQSQTSTLGDYQRLEHLGLLEDVRRSARKRLPTKNYLERQRLKAMREEPSETDGS